MTAAQIERGVSLSDSSRLDIMNRRRPELARMLRGPASAAPVIERVTSCDGAAGALCAEDP